jgi:AcrR family transcriptional regulator
MAKTRMAPTERKEQLLTAAIRVAERVGYNKINRLMIVKELGGEVTDGLVNRYFGQRHSLRQAVLYAGIERGNLTILAQGLALGDTYARKAPAAMRKAAAHVVASWAEALGA